VEESVGHTYFREHVLFTKTVKVNDKEGKKGAKFCKRGSMVLPAVN
jgi:hypothetical protein